MCKFELWRVATRSCPSTWCTCYCKSPFSFLNTSGVSRFLERFQGLGNWWSQNGVQMYCSDFVITRNGCVDPIQWPWQILSKGTKNIGVFVGGLSLYLESSSNRLPILKVPNCCQSIVSWSILIVSLSLNPIHPILSAANPEISSWIITKPFDTIRLFQSFLTRRLKLLVFFAWQAWYKLSEQVSLFKPRLSTKHVGVKMTWKWLTSTPNLLDSKTFQNIRTRSSSHLCESFFFTFECDMHAALIDWGSEHFSVMPYLPVWWGWAQVDHLGIHKGIYSHLTIPKRSQRIAAFCWNVSTNAHLWGINKLVMLKYTRWAPENHW